MARGTPKWLGPAIVVSGLIAFWAKMSSAASSAAPRHSPTFATTSVDGREYAVTRLGQGNYLVALVSTRGVAELVPVSFTFNQTGPVGAFGDPGKVAQLQADLPRMALDFRA